MASTTTTAAYDLTSEFFIFAGQSVLSLVAFGAAAEFLIRYIDRCRRRRKMTRYDLRGKRVLITGASSGLGRALAREFYLSGARVIVTARSISKLQELCDELKSLKNPIDIRRLRESGRRSIANKLYDPELHYLDLADTSTIAEAAGDILKMTEGRLDVLINNAGMSMRGSCQDTTMAVHRQLMEVNYFGHIDLTRLMIPAMQNTAAQQPRGYPAPVIVCIGSVQGRFSLPNRSAYAASKHAFQAYFDCLRAELAAYGSTRSRAADPVRVFTVCPGYIRTNLSINAVSADGSSYGRMDETTKGGQTPEAAAKKILNGVVECKKEMIMATCGPRMVINLRPWLPNTYFWWLEKRAKREEKSKWAVGEQG